MSPGAASGIFSWKSERSLISPGAICWLRKFLSAVGTRGEEESKDSPGKVPSKVFFY